MSIQIEYKGLPPSEAVTTRISQRVDHLLRTFPKIVGGRIVVELSNHRHRKGNLFCVKVELHVPGAQIVHSRAHSDTAAHADVYVAVRDAFDATERLLHDHAAKLRRDVKHHEPAWTSGKVAKLFPYEGYGFIATADDREVYFDANALVDSDFDGIDVGSVVRFCEEIGENGPQATTVHA